MTNNVQLDYDEMMDKLQQINNKFIAFGDKIQILRRLKSLEKRGAIITKPYNANTPYEDILNEYINQCCAIKEKTKGKAKENKTLIEYN